MPDGGIGSRLATPHRAIRIVAEIDRLGARAADLLVTQLPNIQHGVGGIDDRLSRSVRDLEPDRLDATR